MNSIQRIAFVGNHLPRLCGIATFTHDLHRAVSMACPGLETSVVAMTDAGSVYNYPSAVRFAVRDDILADYVEAAKHLNAGGFDVVSLQHEYGIFGGQAGGNIIELLSRLKMPIVTTLHTVLANPTPTQRNIMQRIIDTSSTLVVMAAKGRHLLRTVHDVPANKIEVIPHGIPNLPFRDTSAAKQKLGFAGKTVILTFGLLSPNKGIETMIDAMPGILRSCPDAIYVILGASHPTLVRQQGEAYRHSLIDRVDALGIHDHVVFFNQFVEQATLLDFISMCDVYVTPYLNEAQMTSGTLAYSFGLGRAVVSTPYWHASELLSDGHGILVPFGDAKAFSTEIAALLTDSVRRDAMRERAYAASRSMTWPETAKRYLTTFERVRAPTLRPEMPRSAPVVSVHPGFALPKLRTRYFQSLCDSTGVLQHAVFSVADRNHGYCVDDNARALLFSCVLANSGDQRMPEALTGRFAAFIQHAWNPDIRRFRNFMSYERRWLEPAGSEDSHGRTLWALAECARSDTDASRRAWAAALFKTALPVIEEFSSPRAWAFSLLGLDAYCTLQPSDRLANGMRKLLADRLMMQFRLSQREGWHWFEDVLAYDNARLSQALIQTGLAMKTPQYVDAGLKSLRWLMSLQTASSGHFRPVGSKSFGNKHQMPEAFDQQPVEAWAAISACFAAWRADGDAEWLTGAKRAFGWFLGSNDLRTALIDAEAGSCSDGLHPDRPNENKGAESVLSYLLGLIEIRQFMAAESLAGSASKSLKGVDANEIRSPLGSFLVPLQIRQSPEPVFAPGSDPSRRQAVQAGD